MGKLELTRWSTLRANLTMAMVSRRQLGIAAADAAAHPRSRRRLQTKLRRRKWICSALCLSLMRGDLECLWPFAENSRDARSGGQASLLSKVVVIFSATGDYLFRNCGLALLVTRACVRDRRKSVFLAVWITPGLQYV